MATITKAWDTTAPAGSSFIKDGDNTIRDDKLAVKERLNNLGARWENDTNAKNGRIQCGQQGTTGECILAEEEDGDSLITLRDGTDVGGNAEVEVGDGVGGSRPYDLKVDNVACATLAASGAITGDRTHTVTIPLTDNSLGVIDGLLLANTTGNDMTLVSFQLVCFDKPSGGVVELDILDWTIADTDPAAAPTIFTGSKPQIPDDTYAGSAVTSGFTATFSDGHALVFDLDQVNGADNILLIVKLTKAA